MSWKDLTDAARIIIDIVDELLFEIVPYAFDKYITEIPIWILLAVMTLISAATIYLTLAPTRRGDMSNVGMIMLMNAAAKASRGLFVLGFYGSIFMVFAIVVLRNIS